LSLKQLYYTDSLKYIRVLILWAEKYLNVKFIDAM